MKVVVVSPTYNEIENVAELISQVHNTTPESDILIVDDNSPDGTHKLVRELMKTDPQLHLIVRAGKMGLGTAYCEGFKWALTWTGDRLAASTIVKESIYRLLKHTLFITLDNLRRL